MNATVSELVGLGVAFVVLAGIAYAIANGTNTANILGTMGNVFIGSIQAATGQPVGNSKK